MLWQVGTSHLDFYHVNGGGLERAKVVGSGSRNYVPMPELGCSSFGAPMAPMPRGRDYCGMVDA